MQRPLLPCTLATIALALGGCTDIQDDVPLTTLTVTTSFPSAQELLLVTDADGVWQPVAIVDQQATFTPATPAFGVSYACRYPGPANAGMLASTTFRTIADGTRLHFAGCQLSAANGSVSVVGLAANQKLVVGSTTFTAATATQPMVLAQPELMGVLWQIEPPVVLGFVRQAILPGQTGVSLNATTALAPEFIELVTDVDAPPLQAGLTGFYRDGALYDLQTFGPSDAGTIAVPPAAFRQPGDLMEIDATEFISPTSLRYVQRLVDAADTFRPVFPVAWDAAAPQLAQGIVSFSFTPRASWAGEYSAHIQTFGPEGTALHRIAVSSAWPQSVAQTTVTAPDLKALAAWATPLADEAYFHWWTDATAVSSPQVALGRELQVARNFAPPP